MAEPIVWRFRIGMQNLWGCCEDKSDAEFHIKQSGIRKFELEPLFAAGEVEKLEAELSRLRKENAELREALKPFADYAVCYGSIPDSAIALATTYGMQTFRVDIADFRHARSALASVEAPEAADVR